MGTCGQKCLLSHSTYPLTQAAGTLETAFRSPLSRPLEYYVLKTIRSYSNAQARPCSNKATSIVMKKHVATNVATPKHTQDTQEYLINNHEKEEPNQTH